MVFIPISLFMNTRNTKILVTFIRTLSQRAIMLLITLFFICGAGISCHAAAQREDLESIRTEVILIKQSMSRFYQDQLAAVQSLDVRLLKMSDAEVVEFYVNNMHDSSLSLPSPKRIKEKMKEMIEGNKNVYQQNLIRNQGLIDCLKSAKEDALKRIARDGINELLQVLQARQTNQAIPKTIPELMKLYPKERQQMAERAIIIRADESAMIKLLSRTLTPAELNHEFSPLVINQDFGGYFTVLHAYFLDLVENPPLPDHWIYRVNEFNKKESLSLVTYLKRVKGTMEETSPRTRRIQERLTSIYTLIKELGSLQSLKETEEQAVQSLELYQRGKLCPGDWRTEKAVSVLETTLLDEMLDEVIEEHEEKAAKKIAANRKKKERQKKAKAAAKNLPSLSPFVDTPPDTEAVPAADSISSPPSPQRQISEGTQTSIEEGMAAFAAELESYKGKKKQSSPPPVAAAAETTSSQKIFLKPGVYEAMQYFWEQPTMEWDTFLTLMTNPKIGFRLKSNGGSAYSFSYTEARHGQNGKFNVHKPHGVFGTMLGINAIRYVRRELRENLNWSLESFAALV
ncbi:MAG: hypothetical protein A2621_04180 [Alphaproteobacteria bacterium RIFCSPHIGHO2_01_FULL_41_14]|nr:MAG: hypothetical protein A2065_03925 [Alphaproteobacteria bacterium GWB1_45_5]OFW76007.1 MAG: hypothetical protein A3K20_04115 [Alphaproteobacteria bacterium GWA1_45_9]OFW90045.1 MAG: hypothetical protein A2621_04180 [Alphaproteobacteria bacterium RIFCSPHIGHO2_01_FULL_41_14]HCI48582.1 hypothetical protein [Holosporales bacterium]